MSTTKTPPVEGTRAISPMPVLNVERSSWAYWVVLIGILGKRGKGLDLGGIGLRTRV